LSGRGLCDELIARPEESYRLWCLVVCDLETSRIGGREPLRAAAPKTSTQFNATLVKTLSVHGLLRKKNSKIMPFVWCPKYGTVIQATDDSIIHQQNGRLWFRGCDCRHKIDLKRKTQGSLSAGSNCYVTECILKAFSTCKHRFGGGIYFLIHPMPHNPHFDGNRQVPQFYPQGFKP
jgi:hypothetical protein